jgi:hypothetical protein
MRPDDPLLTLLSSRSANAQPSAPCRLNQMSLHLIRHSRSMPNPARKEMWMNSTLPLLFPPTQLFRPHTYLHLIPTYGVKGVRIWIPCRQRRNRPLRAGGRSWIGREVAVVGRTTVSKLIAMSSSSLYNASLKRCVWAFHPHTTLSAAVNAG